MTSATGARPARVAVLCLLGALLGLVSGCGSSSTSAGTVVTALHGVDLPGADQVTAVVPTGTLTVRVGGPLDKVDSSDTLNRKGHDAPDGGSFVPFSWSFDPAASALPAITTAAGLRPTTLSLRVGGHTWPVASAYRLQGGLAVGSGTETAYVAVPTAHPDVTVVVSYDGLDQVFRPADGTSEPTVATALAHRATTQDVPCAPDGWHSTPAVSVSVSCQLTAPSVLPYVAGHGWMPRDRRWLFVHLDATPSISVDHRPAHVVSVTDRSRLRRGTTSTGPLARRAVHAQAGVVDDDLVFDTAPGRPPSTVRVELDVHLSGGPVHRVRIWRDVRLP